MNLEAREKRGGKKSHAHALKYPVLISNFTDGMPVVPMMVYPVAGQPHGMYPNQVPGLFYTAPFLPQMSPWQLPMMYPVPVTPQGTQTDEVNIL